MHEPEMYACRECGRTVSIHSDEFGEWAALPNEGGKAICFDCFRREHGEHEFDRARTMVHELHEEGREDIRARREDEEQA